MLTASTGLIALRERLATWEASGRAQAASQRALVTLATPALGFEPLALFEQAAGLERLYWRSPGGTTEIAGVGLEILPERSDWSVSDVWLDLAKDAQVAPAEPGPIAFTGTAFDPGRVPDGAWDGWPRRAAFLPRLVAVQRGSERFLQLQLLPDAAGAGPEHLLCLLDRFGEGRTGLEGDISSRTDINRTIEDPNPPRWRELVRGMLEAIAAGEVDKLVLARCQRLDAERPFDVHAVLRRLRSRYGDCTVFAIDRGADCFIGATPELLVTQREGIVRTAAVAGSAPRAADVARDAALSAELLADPKEQHEHALVVRALEDGLRPLCRELHADSGPSLLRLANVQHLYTEITGALGGATTAFDVALRLHPTPAVGGVPRDRAQRLLRSAEPFDRGWFGGPLGWMDARGDGEFVIAIRSALINGTRARLYAGCGIVAGSEAAREYEESRLKMQSMRWALGCP